MLNQQLLLIKKYESRTLYRHSSGMGTVICYNDGVDREVLVLDAKYRTLGNLNTSRYKELVGKVDNWSNINGNPFLNGVISSYNTPNRFKVTDRYLNKLWFDTTYDTKTSKYNTDVLIDCTAAQHCRSIKVNGVGCDIPNIQILMRIYCEANRLDGLDPTVTQYATYAFGDVNPNGWWKPGATNDFWSSTRINDSSSFLQIRFEGRCVSQYIGYDYGVCPVLEL
jgi:hypothetical protein